MKKTVIYLIFSMIFAPLCVTAQTASKSADKGVRYKIGLELKGEKNKDVLLVMHYGSNKYSIDTATLDKHGKGEFSGDKALTPGMYLLAIEGSQIFDFLIPDTVNQTFSVFADARTSKDLKRDKLLESLTFKGSSENQEFADFTRFLIDIQKQELALAEKAKQLDSVQLKALYEEEETLSQKILVKVTELNEKFPGTFLASISKSMYHPKAKQSELPAENTAKQRFIYEHIKKHYWDNIVLTDTRMQNTPILLPALENYFNTIVPRIPDSIIHHADNLIARTGDNVDMRRFVVAHIFNHYVNLKTIMGMENVVIHIIDNYYLTGKVISDDEKFMKNITEFADKNRPSLIGKQGQNLKMESITGSYEALYDIDSPYTLVCFFETACGHCKVEMPKIYKVFQQYKDKGLAGYCVYNLTNKEEWIQYVSTNNYTDWINVWDPKNENNFKMAYSVHSVPQVFLLDKDKKIIGRNLENVSLTQLLKHLIKE